MIEVMSNLISVHADDGKSNILIVTHPILVGNGCEVMHKILIILFETIVKEDNNRLSGSVNKFKLIEESIDTLLKSFFGNILFVWDFEIVLV